MLLRLDTGIAEFEDDPDIGCDINGNVFPEVELTCLDDTGCDTMSIKFSDMKLLMGDDACEFAAPANHLMGFTKFRNADGSTCYSMIIAVEINMYGEDENGDAALMLNEWTPITCAVFPEEADSNPHVERLNGPWLRQMFYVGSAPVAQPSVYGALGKKAFMAGNLLPRISPEERVVPAFTRPRYGVRWIKTADGDIIPRPDKKKGGRVPGETE
ncbi:hypothetical protein N7456_009276 [Penicillium angulare]|uniref:Uncharacterized protein n=1 Tax=Penicillium angulare TaxID=116970 RepID=A0A9W9F4M7_9EURO|nr:hypothetical protein N7456_009276 [Penicillium angulare]